MGKWLEDDDLFKLTGYRQKGRQIAQLRKMGVPFFVNASGHPVVAQSVADGTKTEKAKQGWAPAWAGSRA